MKVYQRIKCYKLKKWENYLDFVESMDKNTAIPLLVGDNSDLLEAEEAKLYSDFAMYGELERKYHIKEIAGSGGAFEKALNIMQWLTDNTFYSGASMKWNSDNSVDILEYSYKRGFSHAICCREKAIVLADCLIAIGLQAYPVCMIADKNKGCHFTTQVYINELNKWVMFDPSFNCWFKENDVILNIIEIRNIFLEGREPQLVNYAFNGTERCKDVYLMMFVKQCLTNLTTWNNNSMDRRYYKKNDWNSKKEFKTKLPK